MKKMIKTAIVALSATAALSTSAFAGNTGVGVGVTGDSMTIRGDFMIQEGFRLEPYFSLDYKDNKAKNTTITLGTAAHLIGEISPTITMYYGGFAGFTSDDPTNGSTFNLGPVAGVEYAFDPQFTLGAEVKFNMGFGDTTVMQTASAVTLRYYFD